MVMGFSKKPYGVILLAFLVTGIYVGFCLFKQMLLKKYFSYFFSKKKLKNHEKTNKADIQLIINSIT
jgi:hypothetical protein